MLKTLARSRNSTPSPGPDQGGEGSSFVRRLFAAPRPEAEPLPSAMLLAISLVLSAMLVGIVTVAVANW